MQVIEASNFPVLTQPSTSKNGGPGSPFIREPDTVVRVRSEVPGLTLLGPEYVLQPQPASFDERVFALYEGATPFTILAARLVRQDAGRDAGVLTHSDYADAAGRELLSDISTYAATVRNYLRRLFGEPAVREGPILAVSVAGLDSTCLGSGIVLNTTASFSATDPSIRRARLIARLAHEYAHMWWSYSTFWTNSGTHDLVTEMLAFVLERDCVTQLEGPTLAETRKELWGFAGHASLQPEARLLREVSLSSAMYAASILIDLTFWERDRVVAALEQLWNEGRTEHLSRERLLRVVSSHVSEPVAVALSDALQHPKPLEAAARVDRSASGEWRILLRPRRGMLRRLRRRLIAMGYLQSGDDDPHSIAIKVGGQSELVGRLNALEPAHVMFLRSKRLLAIHSRPWLTRLWNWSSRPDEHDSFPRILTSLFRYCLALILNMDDPTGWKGLSYIFASSWPRMGRRFLMASARRAIYAGEEHLSDPLERP
jgi:hypothetical protein